MRYRAHVIGMAGIMVVLVAAPLSVAQDPAAPAADAEKTRSTSVITFYGHVFGSTLNNPMPANTQFPTGEDNYGVGATDVCEPVNVYHDCDSDPNNKLAFYSTAGFVQVSSGSEFSGGGSYKQLHNERGSTKDIVLDPQGTIQGALFVSQDAHGWFVGDDFFGETYCVHPNPRDSSCLYPYWGWDPGFSPAFSVKASLYHAVLGEYGGNASDQPPIREAIEDGTATLVAEAERAPERVINGLPNYPNVYEFDVDLGSPKVTTIPKEANFFIVFSVYNVAPDGSSKYSGHTWRWWSGEFFPPRFTLPVKNAFDVESVVPQFVHGKLAILGIINTPWGSYDVDPKATRLTITDASGSEVTPVRIETVADYSVAHGAHYKPVNLTFVWDWQADALKPGRYVATISAANHQRSAASSCASAFTIAPDGTPGSVEPGLCGLQTGAEHRAAVGDASAPAASGGDADAGVTPPLLPALPVVAFGGIVLRRRRRWP